MVLTNKHEEVIMPRFIRAAGLIFSATLLFATIVLAAEEITITTYYPSPYGSYNSLQVDKLGVGDNNGDGSLSAADVPTTSGDVWIKGNVGIGITIPITNLDVNGGVQARSGVYFGSDSTVGINKDASSSLSIRTGNADGQVVVTSGGKVGIGTTSPDPAARLEVNGQVKITGGTPGNSKVLTSDANGLASWQAAGGGVALQPKCPMYSIDWNGPAATVCTPPGCPAGYTNAGTGCARTYGQSQLNGGAGGFGIFSGGGYCERYCLPSHVLYQPKCSMYFLGWTGPWSSYTACSPPSCAAGYTDAGTGCVMTYGQSELNKNAGGFGIFSGGGYCERYCR